MTVFTETVDLRLTAQEAAAYSPKKKGINVIWNFISLEDMHIRATFNGSDNNPGFEVNKEDIDRELVGAPITRDSAPSPDVKTFMKIETLLDNPLLDSKDHLRSTKRVNKVKIPAFELNELNKKYEKEGLRTIKPQEEYDFGVIEEA